MTAPTVSLTTPTNEATLSGTTNVTATATDNVAVAGVQFTIDNQNLGTEDTAAPYSVSWNTTTAGNGTHTLTAIVRDAAGNRATSTRSVVVLNNITTTSCTLNGVTFATGNSLLFFSANTVAYPATCASISQVRTCTNGVLSGSSAYASASCVVTGAPDVPPPAAMIKSIFLFQVGGWTGVANRQDLDLEWPLYGGPDAYVRRSPDILAHQMSLIADLGPNVAIAVLLMTDTDSNLSGYGACWNGTWGRLPGRCSTGTLLHPFAMYDHVRAAARHAGVRYLPEFSLMNYDGVRGSGVLPKLQQAISWWRTKLPDPYAAKSPDGKYYVVLDSLAQQTALSAADKVALITYMKSQTDIIWLDRMVNASTPPTNTYYHDNVFHLVWGDETVQDWYDSFERDGMHWTFLTNKSVHTYASSTDAAYKFSQVAQLKWLNVAPHSPTKYPVMIDQWNEYAEYHMFEPSSRHSTRIYDYIKWMLSRQPNVVPPETVAPVVSISAPVASSNVSGTVVVSATASDNVGVAGVQFKLDGVNLGNEDTVAPHFVSWNTASTTNGTHTITAVARDAAGNRATSTVSVTVNNPVAVRHLTMPVRPAGRQGMTSQNAPGMDGPAVYQRLVSDFGFGVKQYGIWWGYLEASGQLSTATATTCPAGYSLYPKNESERAQLGYHRYHCYKDVYIANFDRFFSEDAQYGLQVSAVLWNAPRIYRDPRCTSVPSWAAEPSLSGCVPRDDAMDDYEDYVNFLASRYNGGVRGKIDYFVVWNEVEAAESFDYYPTVPNTGVLTQAQVDLWTHKYADMMRRAHTAVARHMTSTMILASTHSRWEPKQSGAAEKAQIGSRAVLEGLWRDLGIGIEWAVAVHPYGDPVVDTEPADSYLFANLQRKVVDFATARLRALGITNPDRYPQNYIAATEQSPFNIDQPDLTYRAKQLCMQHDTALKIPNLLYVVNNHFYQSTSTDKFGIIPYTVSQDLHDALTTPTGQAYAATNPAVWKRNDTNYCCVNAGVGCLYPKDTVAPTGMLSAADCTIGIKGWAQDMDVPQGAVDVHLYIDKPTGVDNNSGFVAHMLANRNNSCNPVCGIHTFIFPIPDRFRDGLLHRVYVYAIDMNRGTHGSPLLPGATTTKTFQCSL